MERRARSLTVAARKTAEPHPPRGIMSSTRIRRFAALFHYRWAVPILAELHHTQGSKFVTLTNRLGVGRDSLRRTLDVLIARGWVIRNPGHGHPMRPEYVLTAAGLRLAPWCSRFTALMRALGIEEVGLRKWSMPIALALQRGLGRFSEIKAFLPGLTSRALTLALKELQGAGLVERVVVAGYPPVTFYCLTDLGCRFRRVLNDF